MSILTALWVRSARAHAAGYLDLFTEGIQPGDSIELGGFSGGAQCSLAAAVSLSAAFSLFVRRSRERKAAAEEEADAAADTPVQGKVKAG